MLKPPRGHVVVCCIKPQRGMPDVNRLVCMLWLVCIVPVPLAGALSEVTEGVCMRNEGVKVYSKEDA